MKIYRVGEGQTPSGKILDRGTRWYKDLNSALKYAIETYRKIYVSYGKQKYRLYYENGKFY